MPGSGRDREAVDGPDVIAADDLDALTRTGAPLPEQRAALARALSERGVADRAIGLVLDRTRPGIALTGTRDPRRTRIGGPGVLPPGAAWPGRWAECFDGVTRFLHLALLAVIDFSELPHVPPLPPDGTLVLYHDLETHGFGQPFSGTRALYVPKGEPLVEAPEPEHVTFPLPGRAMTGVAVPISGEPEAVLRELPEEEHEPLIEAMNDLSGARNGDHHLAGSSVDIQGPALEEVAWTLQELAPSDRPAFTDAELAGVGWTLLAQVNEEPAIDLAIGDGGALYFVIPAIDLAARRFDRVLAVMQCH